jgi:hypothetical protein
LLQFFFDQYSQSKLHLCLLSSSKCNSGMKSLSPACTISNPIKLIHNLWSSSLTLHFLVLVTYWILLHAIWSS